MANERDTPKPKQAEDRIYDLSDVPAEISVKPASLIARLYGLSAVRRIVIIASLVVLWHLYAQRLENPLLLPTPGEAFDALCEGIKSGVLLSRMATSLSILLIGYAGGLVLAGILTSVAMTSKLGRDFLATLTAMFNPLPAIALLPLAMLWFGIGTASLVFVLVHSVVWSVSLNTLTGFEAVSPTLRMVGRNYGLRGPAYILRILVPAAFPSLLIGLKVGWAFAWRTLIAAELVFGVSAGSGGLGWFIYENKNQLEIPSVFAGLGAVVLLGLAVEYGIFRVVERRTVARWGMQV